MHSTFVLNLYFCDVLIYLGKTMSIFVIELLQGYVLNTYFFSVMLVATFVH